MGGKTSTSKSDVSIPPSVLAQYQSVNSRADATANLPFENYGGQFVAPVNATQAAGIAGTSAAANEAQPYFQAATGTLGSAQAGVNPINAAAESGTAASAAPISGADIGRYLSPYLSTVLGSTEALQNQSNQQQQAGQLGDAIRSGSFGGDRTGIAAANLEQQQNLANANVISGIANQGYQSALGTATTEQQLGLAGAKQLADIGQTAYGEGANTSAQLAGLGAGAQSAGLSGAAAQIQAGTVAQQTQQAQDTAKYNQFLQQQSYPFQVDQFLANIAEGTGALSGSTTTTTQPGGFFSDKRLKRDIRKVGRTFDGQDVVTYKMGEDERTHIGLIAQDVEKKHPHAVGLAGGFKTVDFGKATEKAANQGHFYAGGVVPFRRARDAGGGLDSVLETQRQMYGNAPGNQQRRINEGGVGGGRSLAVANAPAEPPPSGASNVEQSMGIINNANKLYKSFSGPSAPAAAGSGYSGPGALSLGDTSASALPQIAGAQASGAVTAAAPEATAAAAPAAADAAGLGAADAAGAAGAGVAAGAGAGAAAGLGAGAAGAAGTALVAGGGEAAAAEAAAALAAEYFAADAAVVAVAAAKRGGRIHRQGGGGLVPYLASGSNDSGELNIPEQANQNTLKAAPGAGKLPTGMQSMMHMMDPQNWDSLSGSVLSNQALKRGGVAGRAHYADGGSPDDDADTDTPDAAAPAPSSDAAAAPSGGVSGKPSFWSKAKDFATSPGGLAILRGIGAMGTTRNIHPGVALAAGLAEGATAYPQIQEEQAEAARRTAQAKNIDIQRQLSEFGLGQAKESVAPGPEPYALPDRIRPDGMPQGAANDPQEQAFNQFAPYQTARPDAVNRKVEGLSYVNPDASKAEGGRYDQWIAKKNQTLQLGASLGYQVAADIATGAAPALPRVAKLNAGVATQIQQTSSDPAVQDKMARDWAARKALYTHQYSGRPITMDNGVMIDSQTGTPVPGQAQVMTGLDANGKAAKYAEGMTPITLKDGLPGFRFQEQLGRNGTIEQYVINADRAARLSGAAPKPGVTPPASAAAAAPPPAPPGSAPPATPPQRPAATAPRTPANAPAAPPASTGDKYFDTALRGAAADPRYREDLGPPATNQESLKARTDQQAANIKYKNDLRGQATQVAQEQAAARQYLLAAKEILKSKSTAPVTGLPGYLLHQLGKPVNSLQTADYQVLAKNLINAAQQQFRTNFGGGGTQTEFQTQVEEMSPSAKMADRAIIDLTNLGLRTSDYMLKSADRAQIWSNTPGVNPLAFNNWNQNNYRRDIIVNADKTGTGKDGVTKWYHVGNRWMRANGQ